MDIQEVRDLSTRLEPVRRILADLAAIADKLPAASQQLEEAEAKAQAYRKDFQDLELRLRAFQQRAEIARQATRVAEETSVEAVAQARKRQAEAEQESVDRIAAAQSTMTKRLAELQKQFDEELARLKAEREQAEARKQTAEQMLNDLLARVARP